MERKEGVWYLVWWFPIIETRDICGPFIFEWRTEWRIAGWLRGGW
jgi:hypothetical protein